MKKTLLFLSFLPVCSIYAQTDNGRLDEVLQAAVDLKNFNGVALVARHDSILLMKGYGWRDYEHQIPHDTNSVFLIGSVTKQFTATVILWLRDQGKLSVNDPLSKYFPKYAYGGKITIKNLLTHTSGISELTDDDYLANHADKPFSQKDFWDKMGTKPLQFEPGSQFEYCNTNYMLLGYIIEAVSGKSYEQMVREVIFNKAGMTHSGFDFTDLPSPFKSVGYDSLNDTVHKRARISDSSATFSAGAMYTTAGDLYRWNLALYTNSIVSQSSLEEAFTPYKEDYGYGWYVDSARGFKYMSHNGGTWGFESHIRRFPKSHACVILLWNEMISADDFSISLDHILFHDPDYYIPRKTIAIPVDSLMQFSGKYELTGKPEFKGDIYVDSGHLMVKWTNTEPQEIFAEKKDFFHFSTFNCQLAFTRDERGQVCGFSGYVGGQTFVYGKTKGQ